MILKANPKQHCLRSSHANPPFEKRAIPCIYMLVLLAGLVLSLGCQESHEAAPAKQQPPEETLTMTETPQSTNPSAIYAVFETSLGNFKARLFHERAPITVENFIDLAEGKKAWRDPKTGKMVEKPLYDGRKIFRVIEGFMFQTGSANDTGAYDAGFEIEDEFHPDLTFDKPGLLAMANRGPNTGSCQFFVTFSGRGAQHLTGRHPIFGEVVDGMETIRAIEKTEVGTSGFGERSTPVNMPVIEKVTIEREY